MVESPWLQRGGSAQLPFPTVCVIHRKIPPPCHQSPAANSTMLLLGVKKSNELTCEQEDGSDRG